MHVVYWGTYDVGRTRNRILLRGLRSNGVEVNECNSDVWAGVRDKSDVVGRRAGLKITARLLASYPGLIWRYSRVPRHDIVLVGYLGHLDLLVIWPLAKLRRAKIVWNAYISLYDTVVEDRRMFSRRSPLAWGLFVWEWLCCRAADLILTDTEANAAYFSSRYVIEPDRIATAQVGVEPEFFPRAPNRKETFEPDQPTTVLFYGQMIPLHGIETILSAAELAGSERILWTLIGQGQDEEKVYAALDNHRLPKVTWVLWVPFEDLIQWIQKADICLGIFGNSDKASRVIPNKVFEVLASGKPIVTMDSPGIRELLSPDMLGVKLVKAGDPQALYEGVVELGEQRATLAQSELHVDVLDRIFPKAIGAELVNIMDGLSA